MVPQNYSQIALGGDDQNLVIHDIYSNCNVFKARALHDSRNLDLEEHVSISGIEFLDVNTICTTTRQHAVRIYDPRTKRRPVMHNYVPNSISLSYTSVTSCDRPERVLVGTNRGLVQALELRNNLKAVKTSKTSIGAIVKVVGTTHPFAVVNCLNKYFHIIDTKTLETRFKVRFVTFYVTSFLTLYLSFRNIVRSKLLVWLLHIINHLPYNFHQRIEIFEETSLL